MAQFKQLGNGQRCSHRVKPRVCKDRRPAKTPFRRSVSRRAKAGGGPPPVARVPASGLGGRELEEAICGDEAPVRAFEPAHPSGSPTL